MHSKKQSTTTGIKDRRPDVFSQEMDPESTQSRTSCFHTVTWFDKSMENKPCSPINFDSIKSDLDRLFKNLRRFYESEQTLNNRIQNMTTSVEARSFVRKLTYKIYFHLIYIYKCQQPVSTDNKSVCPRCSVEMAKTEGEPNRNIASEKLYAAAKVMSENFLNQFFRRMSKPRDMSNSQELHTAVKELQKEVLNMPMLPEGQNLLSTVYQDDMSKLPSLTPVKPFREDGQIPQITGTVFEDGNISSSATTTLKNRGIYTGKCRTVPKHVSFDCDCLERKESDSKEDSPPKFAPKRPLNSLEDSNTIKEEDRQLELWHPSPNCALKGRGIQTWSDKSFWTSENSNTEGGEGELSLHQPFCLTCNRCLQTNTPMNPKNSY
ncbi:hypothetical protein ILYODFUR_035348 [Ilyodon furcidens]|uniref:Uncharacterized protein n=1 Tax=Ilyodon furcidens TaxID=33524 RepID=A0ABV0UQG4_9TELE